MRYLIIAAALLPASLSAQGVNAYAQVTAIVVNVLTIGSYSESVTSFAVGKDVVLMQMQDNVIGANTANNSNFGNLSSIQQAGRYAVRRITSITRVLGAPVAITLNSAPGIAFNFGTGCSVQLITFEKLGGGGNYTLASSISPPAWDGTLGGVVAVQVTGTLTMSANITADGVGFRGGARDRFNYTTPCNTTDYVWSSTGANTDYFASKGEGIYKNTNTALQDARGKIINGGGGGNQINAGGGGGGNYSAGGSAVLGWSCTADAGGIGGIALNSNISANRIFMGGGGGGGEGNDDVSTDGANGGGIVLIKASQIKTSGTCAVRISADGNAAANSGNDGAGGGGAGGTVVLQVPSYSLAVACPLTIRANGGNGGSVAYNGTHGGGGGGGQGAVIFSTAAPTTNVVVQTTSGTGGCNETPCVGRAGSGAGTSNSGVIPGSVGPLPVELLSFQAISVDARVDVRWSTATEQNNASFTVQRSLDMVEWQDVVTLPGAIDSQSQIDYACSDRQPLPGLSYYRLKQTDLDGSSTLSAAVPVQLDSNGPVMGLFPNPAQEHLTVLCDGLDDLAVLQLTDALGRPVTVPMLRTQGRADLDIAGLVPGSYIVLLWSGGHQWSQRLVVQR